MSKYLSASLMCADLTNLKSAIEELEKAGVEYLHIDIMDGSFVPNITLGFDFVNAVKAITSIPLDVHMMVNEPSRFIDRMNLDENDYLCIHYESENHLQRTLASIKQKGWKTGVAINPQTPPESLQYLTEYIDMVLVMTVSPGFAGQKIFAGAERKTLRMRELLNEWGCDNIIIEVDGNISPENGKKLSKCGADIFVLGTSSLFIKDKDMRQSAEEFREII